MSTLSLDSRQTALSELVSTLSLDLQPLDGEFTLSSKPVLNAFRVAPRLGARPSPLSIRRMRQHALNTQVVCV